MNSIRAITLDLDDTLWEIHPLIRRAEAALYAWLDEHYPRITARFDRDDLYELRRQVIAEFAERAHDLTFLRRTVLTRAGAAAGYSADFVDEAFEVFDAVRNAPDIFPEVLPALGALQRRYRLIAVTNGNAKLDRIGIGHYFSDFVNAARAGAAKPDRRIFDAAIAAAGTSAAETLHVGDHAELDVDGARRAGLRTAWVNRDGKPWPDELPRPDIEVRDIGELAARLRVA